MILGVFGGLLGAFFNFVNREINILRRIYLNKNWKRVLETMFVAALTAFLIFYAPLITSSDCERVESND